jgi:hypothetical protein
VFRRSALAVVVAAGGALAACSGSSGPPAQVAGGRATTSTGAATSAAAGRVSGADLAARVQKAMTAAGSASFALASSTTSGQDAKGVLRLVDGGVRVRFDFVNGSDTLRVIALPGVLYADVGEVVDGRHWLKVTAGGTDPLSSAMAPLLSYMTNSANVSAQTSTWSATDGFTVGTPRSVGGVETTPYDATIPRAAVQAGLPDQFREIMQKDITGDSHVTLWLDEADRPVKVVTAGSYDHKSDQVTVTYSDWGQAAEVSAPPASDVIQPD